MEGAVRLQPREGDVLGVKRTWHVVVIGVEAKRLRLEDNLTPASAKAITEDDEDYADFFGGCTGGRAWLEKQSRALDAGASAFFAAQEAPSDVHVDELSYCKRHNLWMIHKRKINGGVLIFCHNASKLHMVIKNQKIDLSVRDFLNVAPGQWCTELTAMTTFRYLMAVKGIAPVFCEMLHSEAYLDARAGALLSSMRLARYETNLTDWLTQPKCFAKPAVNVSADAGDLWTFAPGAGRALALSAHPSDVRLFNAILRAVVFQVFLGLSQAQRHVRFCHNDLHTANVMLSTVMLKGNKKIITGFGTFVLPNNCPTVRIIDFQHSSFDVLSSSGDLVRRIRGFQTAWSNERGFFYDVWRFSSHLLMDGLFHLLPAVDTDMKEFLWRAAQLPGEPRSPPPRIEANRHWTPYLLRGVVPEQIISDRHGPFQCFRGDRNAVAAHTFVERGDGVFRCDAQRYMRTVFVQSFPTQRSLARYTEKLKPRPAASSRDAALASALTIYVGNYCKRVSVTMSSNMSSFTVGERAAYLFRELEMFQLGFFILWAQPEALAEELAAGGPMQACAAADAVQCVLRSDLLWTHRASQPEHALFFETVKQTLKTREALVKSAGTQLSTALPCHASLDEFLAAEHEHHLQALKGRELLSVARTFYE